MIRLGPVLWWRGAADVGSVEALDVGGGGSQIDSRAAAQITKRKPSPQTLTGASSFGSLLAQRLVED